MFPNLWIFDTYSIMMLIGIIFSFIIFIRYSNKHNLDKKYIYDILIISCISIIIGLCFAVIFQNIYNRNFTYSMTFYGGLIGGILSFIILFKTIIKKKYPNSDFTKDIYIIAPACITMAHGFGRIGCFLAGCCYGVETNFILGVTFPNTLNKVHPTQLYEAIFLFTLSIILIKKNSIYSMPIYLFSYGIFRFFIEFLRGDYRGYYLFNLSPSQWISILAITISIILTSKEKLLRRT